MDDFHVTSNSILVAAVEHEARIGLRMVGGPLDVFGFGVWIVVVEVGNGFEFGTIASYFWIFFQHHTDSLTDSGLHILSGFPSDEFPRG